MLGFLWRASRGYRLHPWDSPYLRWRVETYWGIPAETLAPGALVRFMAGHRSDLLRFLRWAGRMRQA